MSDGLAAVVNENDCRSLVVEATWLSPQATSAAAASETNASFIEIPPRPSCHYSCPARAAERRTFSSERWPVRTTRNAFFDETARGTTAAKRRGSFHQTEK